jgi:hypothetical protein
MTLPRLQVRGLHNSRPLACAMVACIKACAQPDLPAIPPSTRPPPYLKPPTTIFAPDRENRSRPRPCSVIAPRYHTTSPRPIFKTSPAAKTHRALAERHPPRVICSRRTCIGVCTTRHLQGRLMAPFRDWAQKVLASPHYPTPRNPKASRCQNSSPLTHTSRI